MPFAVCTRKGCNKTFEKQTQQKADQALRMHEGRSHTGLIKTFMPNTSRNGNHVHLKRHTRAILSPEEMEAVAAFILANRDKYDTKTGCLQAALEDVGAAGKIVVNHGAALRYFKKADQSLAQGNGHKPKRKYTRRVQRQTVEPAMTSVVIKCCPMCGCHIDDVAKGIVQGRMERGEKM